jgi:hypothetical protein
MLRLRTLWETHLAGRTKTSAVAMVRGKPVLTVEVTCGEETVMFAAKLVGGHRAVTTVVISRKHNDLLNCFCLAVVITTEQ